MLFRKEIRECDMIPNGYGVTYRMMNKRMTVCHPIPFNIIIGKIRDFYIKLVIRELPKTLEDKIIYLTNEVDNMKTQAFQNSRYIEKLTSYVEILQSEIERMKECSNAPVVKS